MIVLSRTRGTKKTVGDKEGTGELKKLSKLLDERFPYSWLALRPIRIDCKRFILKIDIINGTLRTTWHY